MMNMLSYNNGTYLGSLTWDQEVLKETSGEFRLTTVCTLVFNSYKFIISASRVVFTVTYCLVFCAVDSSLPRDDLARGMRTV